MKNQQGCIYYGKKTISQDKPLPKSMPFPEIDEIDLEHDKESVKSASWRMKGATQHHK